MKKIGIASDHAGYEMKEFLVGYLNAMGYEVLDFGAHSPESVDYADFAHPLAEAIDRSPPPFSALRCHRCTPRRKAAAPITQTEFFSWFQVFDYSTLVNRTKLSAGTVVRKRFPAMPRSHGAGNPFASHARSLSV